MHASQSSLENARSISATINKGILVIQRVMEELESANAAILTAITRHQEILSPLRPIPDDIILAIFQWCSSSAHRAVNSLSSFRAPWTLSHVSRRWRTLAISSPSLWLYVDIIPRELDSDTSNNERDRIAFKLDLYLRRSAECDVFSHIASYYRQNFLNEYLALLLPTAHRWKTLSVFRNSSALALQLAECRFECLIKMEINSWPLEAIPRLVRHVPHIRDLRLSGGHLDAVGIPCPTRRTCSAVAPIGMTLLSRLIQTLWDAYMNPGSTPGTHPRYAHSLCTLAKK